MDKETLKDIFPLLMIVAFIIGYGIVYLVAVLYSALRKKYTIPKRTGIIDKINPPRCKIYVSSATTKTPIIGLESSDFEVKIKGKIMDVEFIDNGDGTYTPIDLFNNSIKLKQNINDSDN